MFDGFDLMPKRISDMDCEETVMQTFTSVRWLSISGIAQMIIWVTHKSKDIWEKRGVVILSVYSELNIIVLTSKTPCCSTYIFCTHALIVLLLFLDVDEQKKEILINFCTQEVMMYQNSRFYRVPKFTLRHWLRLLSTISNKK